MPASQYFRFLTTKYRYTNSSYSSIRRLVVLGIESSCDDAAVSIVDYERRAILSDQRSSDLAAHSRNRGIIPFSTARHHREAIPRLIDAALAEAGLRASDIQLVAVSNRPGIVISLKVGVECALNFARNFHRPLITVHHMRAHALVMRLLDPSLDFPFCTLLISGAHCLICLVRDPLQFEVLADAKSGSPGECLDKLARNLGVKPLNGHYGAAMEQKAKECPPESVHKYAIPLTKPNDDDMDLDFDLIKIRYLNIIHHSRMRKKSSSATLVAEFCAGIQHSVVEHTCQHLALALAALSSSVPEFVENPGRRRLIVAGGVAANQLFLQRISEVASAHEFTVSVPPAPLCTDNGVMVAWTGAEIFASRNTRIGNDASAADIYWPNTLPDSILASYKAEIGPRIVGRRPIGAEDGNHQVEVREKLSCIEG